ncbi:hypothetical protein [Bacillus cereus]|uniref:hypothetical protein n=1 Tax=Bacillus cereus TaxID=1396 RepID=UPI0020CC3609|nr:hypothetical protein [Bacillus cereus]
MSEIYLKETLSAIDTYIKVANDFAIKNGDGKKVVDTIWLYRFDGDSLIVTLTSRGEEIQLLLTNEEWNLPQANMLGNFKLDVLVNNLIEKCKGTKELVYLTPFMYARKYQPDKPYLVYSVNCDKPEATSGYMQGHWRCTHCDEGNHFRFCDDYYYPKYVAKCPKCTKVFIANDDSVYDD